MTKALIVGGGIAGLTAALRLHALGIDVEVFEAAAEIRELGVGINLQPNAVKELTNLGLGERLAGIGVPMHELAYYNKHGQQIWTEPRGLKAGYLWPQFGINRGRFQGLLLQAVRERLGDDRVHSSHYFDRLTQDATGVTAEFLDAKGGKPIGSYRGDILIGADGIHSAVRRFFYPEEAQPRFAGQIMWRGVTDASSFLDGQTMFMAGHKQQKVVFYPMSGEAMRNGSAEINFVAEDSVDPDKPMPREEWNRVCSIDEVAPRFENWAYDWCDVPGIIRGAKEIYVFPKVDRDRIPQWTFGRVTMIGDAAHAMHPAGSSGASQAIVDVRALAVSFVTEADPVRAIALYEKLRLEEVYSLVSLNRDKMGPEWVMVMAEERAPNGFKHIRDVIPADELQRIADDYKRAAGFYPTDVNALDPRVDVDPR
ncbi:flavin-dependent oxidoreductase [Aminobacter aganoensis]|uniref:2-polyprenyl-6-methoxyphenol hydroxylase-like FAD-dependent oxidoreductase n=1 Tax=Aminobacter aganoensis TaxID=83264 RepID=A0A7X0KMV4_9HYPH|nr:flavin-dependent oxidoreductase [Aminobacter aganoensis]MBB6356473.1 2-polyprenyl-6-methoxyphenol hydroxylase-like FAD-dependent oxidoreductase [Aminobacter aganoensis]